jgi:tRNA(Ile)-lysidine synthetase-like protein
MTWISPGALEVRLPAPGSRLVPLGGNGHRTVARLLMEGRVPRADRAAWPVIARGGQPVWIPGICRGHEAVPAPGTLALRMDLAPAG